MIDNKNKTKSVKNFMMIHLLEDSIEFMLCKTRKRAMCELNMVWQGYAANGQISHYQRIIGHSILSAKVICKYLLKEKEHRLVPYKFKPLKLHYQNLDYKYPKDILQRITNCFLFVIRFSKLLNRAHTKVITIPTAKQIIDWTIGKQEWLKMDRFEHIWNHGKKLATPFLESWN
eukprot:283426_1